MFTCDNLKTLLSTLFRNFVELQIKNFLKSEPYAAKVMSRELEDERTWNLFKSLFDCYKTLLCKKTKALNRLEKANKLDISASEVKLIHQNFPQCMHKMFRVLENGGKLKHFQRFYFSLFLKELGMGLHEAQKFWSSYYTKIKGGLCIYCNKIIVIRTDQFCL